MAAETPPALAIVTGEETPELTDDGKRVAAWFSKRGFRVDAVRWDRPTEWEEYTHALVRSCWEYPTDPKRFYEMLAAIQRAGVILCNPPAVIRWNAHKSYVCDLADAGVSVPETRVLDAGTDTTLAAEMARLGVEEAIVKPAVGTGSDGVFRVAAPVTDEETDRFAELLATDDVLLQAFCPDIRAGERSIVFFDGEYSHAWNSLTTDDDITRFEGNDESYEPSQSAIEAAAETCRLAFDVLGLDRPLPYARIDYVHEDGDADGGIAVLELELIEPVLHLEAADAHERFCEAVCSYFQQEA